MKKKDVLTLLKSNQDERGIKHWNNRCGAKDSKLRSFGIGLTKLRKLAKQVGRDHDLALELWQSDYYDAKVIALLIDDPKAITQKQAEVQVEQLDGGYLAHVYSSCDATLSKTPFVGEPADKWMGSKDTIRRRCGFGLLYEISKSNKKNAPDDDYFLERIEHISKSYDNENRTIQLSMGGALMGIGKRNVKLNSAALEVARAIGPINLDNNCEPFEVVKHLTSDYLKDKLGL
jgi:3-methyladenine DNA glycosylase AlkD